MKDEFDNEEMDITEEEVFDLASDEDLELEDLDDLDDEDEEFFLHDDNDEEEEEEDE